MSVREVELRVLIIATSESYRGILWQGMSEMKSVLVITST